MGWVDCSFVCFLFLCYNINYIWYTFVFMHISKKERILTTEY